MVACLLAKTLHWGPRVHGLGRVETNHPHFGVDSLDVNDHGVAVNHTNDDSIRSKDLGVALAQRLCFCEQAAA
jgi:hypothetical protein